MRELLEAYRDLGRFDAHYSSVPDSKRNKAEKDHYRKLDKNAEDTATQVLFCLDRKNKGAW
jgi:hypothetical protein